MTPIDLVLQLDLALLLHVGGERGVGVGMLFAGVLALVAAVLGHAHREA